MWTASGKASRRKDKPLQVGQGWGPHCCTGVGEEGGGIVHPTLQRARDFQMILGGGGRVYPEETDSYSAVLTEGASRVGEIRR